ncbi:hypothetical protein [Streptomyces formicae]|uniref:Uncharacterized protein n=1 Tax=Streptomyces formicae TaxID=1616117 RepID=A0ABY3WI47_9ACTN|nr:hypothetical protein [Streptomyces formicae]UNM11830.1 hypothetical protein J4032_09990 [Streptomyces formicae]
MELQEQEQRLMEIKRRAMLLAVALVSEPFSAKTDERLRAYVADDAPDAQTLAQELCALPEKVLQTRIDELQLVQRTRRTGSGSAGDGPGDAVADLMCAGHRFRRMPMPMPVIQPRDRPARVAPRAIDSEEACE